MDQNKAWESLGVGLPEEIARLKAAGFYEQAIEQIDRLLAEDWNAVQNGADVQAPAGAAPVNPLPAQTQAMRDCLVAHREQMRRLPRDYPFTRAAALEKASHALVGFTGAEFDALVRAQRIDSRFLNGEPRYARRFLETLIDTDDGYAARAGEAIPALKRAQQHARLEKMEADGVQRARIRLKLTLRPADAAFARAMSAAQAAGRSAVRAKFWLPLPAACPSQSEIALTAFTPAPRFVAPEDAAQRTACWALELHENQAVSAEFSYLQTAPYRDLRHLPENAAPAAFLDPAQCLGEQAPHICFTPYLRELAAQLTAGAADEAEKARRIYDYITLNVHYRYMPAYAVLGSIAENGLRSRRGDCGVQTLGFIALCRIAGIPAVWQSGLSVSAERAGCHDWAMFWLPRAGWLYADCSFGGSAARCGDEMRRQHYFGSLDAGRMAANRAFQAPFDPPKESWRNDPYDNQAGEAELEGAGLLPEEYETTMQVEEFTLLQ